MPRLSAIVMRAAQRASAMWTNDPPESAALPFCYYCLKPLSSEIARSRHVANTVFCREAETAANRSSNIQPTPGSQRAQTTDYSPKTSVVDSVLDDMPAFITDEMAKALDELLSAESEGDVVEGDAVDGGATTEDGGMIDDSVVTDGEGQVGQVNTHANHSGGKVRMTAKVRILD